MWQRSIRNEQVIRETLQRACLKRELLILSSPYVNIESHFLKLDPENLLVAAPSSLEEVMHGLHAPDLQVRFPDGTGFLEGRVKAYGIGRLGRDAVLKLGIPNLLEDNDQRGAYRVTRVGHVEVTFSTPSYKLCSGTLQNISTTGVRILAKGDLDGLGLAINHDIAITIPLTPEIKIDNGARIRYRKDRVLGVEFCPLLCDAMLTRLSRWVFMRKEEDREHELQGAVEAAWKGEDAALGGDVRYLALVTGDGNLRDNIKGLLKTLPPIVAFQPTVQAVKDALALDPLLVILHVPGAGLDDRRRLHRLVDGLVDRCPFLLLGTNVDNAQLFEMGQELHAASSYLLGPKPSPFLTRLVQGILRRQQIQAGGQG